MYEYLGRELDPAEVFLDLQAIPLGADFRAVISDALARCRVVLVVIGGRWLTAGGPPGGGRLYRTDDVVRIEIETAFAKKLLVVPVCIEGAGVPPRHILPPSIAALADRNGMSLRRGPDFVHDMARLTEFLRSAGVAKPGPFAAEPDYPFDQLGQF